jgi:hypothetical protein
MKNIALIVLLTIAIYSGQAQLKHLVKWRYASSHTTSNHGLLLLKAQTDQGWRIHIQHVLDSGLVQTSFVFTHLELYKIKVDIKEAMALSGYECSFKLQVNCAEHRIIFQQKIRLSATTGIDKKGSLLYNSRDYSIYYSA